jgi:hypothetical protein
MSEDKQIKDAIKFCKEHLMMINSLSNQQAAYSKHTEEWEKIEHNLIELECKLYNELLLLEIEEVEYLFEELPVLSMLGLHLFKYFGKPEYSKEITLLSESAILLIGILGNAIKTSTENDE